MSIYPKICLLELGFCRIQRRIIVPHSSLLYTNVICAIIVLSKVKCAECYIFSEFCERMVYFSNVFGELPSFSTFFYVWCSLLLFTRPSSVNLFVFWIFNCWLLVFTISTFFPLFKKDEDEEEEKECIGHVVKSPLPRKAFFNKMSEWSRLTFFFNILFLLLSFFVLLFGFISLLWPN